MYEAPDRYKRLISARLPGGESAGLAAREAEVGKLAAARRPADLARPARALLRRRQHRRRADDGRQPVGRVVAVDWLLPWAGAVGVVNLGAMQLARTSRSPASAARATGCRCGCWSAKSPSAPSLWLSLPLYLFPTLDPGTQVIAASIMAGLGIGALGLVVDPALRHRLDGRLHRRRRRLAR